MVSKGGSGQGMRLHPPLLGGSCVHGAHPFKLSWVLGWEVGLLGLVSGFPSSSCHMGVRYNLTACLWLQVVTKYCYTSSRSPQATMFPRRTSCRLWVSL